MGKSRAARRHRQNVEQQRRRERQAALRAARQPDADHVPWRGDPIHVPQGYRLAEAAHPRPLEQMVNCDPGGPLWGIHGDARSVADLSWTVEEFLNLDWVRETIADAGDDLPQQIVERYGEKIPADLAVLDFSAGSFVGLQTTNAFLGDVHQDLVRRFAGVPDLRQALHALYADGWIVPLDNGLLAAPRLMLAAA